MTAIDALRAKIRSKDAVVGVIGLGYVGLPMCIAAARAGFRVIGFDVDPSKTAALMRGESYLGHIEGAAIAEQIEGGRLEATADFARLDEADAILVCVPTPLSTHLEPDLSFVETTAASIAKTLRPGQLIVLESTTYPGTTNEIVAPILERSGFERDRDFLLAYSPEREDPGNPNFGAADIPKVVAADSDDALEIAAELYGRFVRSVVKASSTRVGEAVKLTENVFRAVNIALVNELKVVFDAMDIDVWEVIELAKTKPFGFMPFYPGPGWGGHCIPIDPFYLAWKAREFDIESRFIELAGRVNATMPRWVVDRLALALDRSRGIGLSGAKARIVGVAYKKNVDDMRESPALRLIELLERRGAVTDYYDPLVPEIPPTREHARLAGRRSLRWREAVDGSADALLVVTDHDCVDHAALARSARLVIDTRNACERAGVTSDHVIKA